MFGIDDALLGSIITGGLGFIGNQQTNSANQANAQAQMDFQERMSNTSYQRAVADMNAAGINPMVAYAKGGASTPSGAMATMTNSGVAAAQAAQAAASTRYTNAQAEQQEHVTMVDKYFGGPNSIERAKEELRKLQNETDLLGDQSALVKANTNAAIIGIDKALQEIKTGAATEANLKAQTRNIEVLIQNSKLDQEQKIQFNKMWHDIGEGGAIAKEFAPFIKLLVMIIAGR